MAEKSECRCGNYACPDSRGVHPDRASVYLTGELSNYGAVAILYGHYCGGYGVLPYFRRNRPVRWKYRSAILRDVRARDVLLEFQYRLGGFTRFGDKSVGGTGKQLRDTQAESDAVYRNHLNDVYRTRAGELCLKRLFDLSAARACVNNDTWAIGFCIRGLLIVMAKATLADLHPARPKDWATGTIGKSQFVRGRVVTPILPICLGPLPGIAGVLIAFR